MEYSANSVDLGWGKLDRMLLFKWLIFLEIAQKFPAQKRFGYFSKVSLQNIEMHLFTKREDERF